MPQARRDRHILLGGSGRIADDLSNGGDWLLFLACNRRKRIAGCLSTGGTTQLAFFSKPATTSDAEISGSVLCGAASDDEQQGGGHDEGSRDISKASINRRRQRRRQAGVQHAFDAEAEPCDNPSRGIDHRRDRKSVV